MASLPQPLISPSPGTILLKHPPPVQTTAILLVPWSLISIANSYAVLQMFLRPVGAVWSITFFPVTTHFPGSGPLFTFLPTQSYSSCSFLPGESSRSTIFSKSFSWIWISVAPYGLFIHLKKSIHPTNIYVRPYARCWGWWLVKQSSANSPSLNELCTLLCDL